MCPHGSRSRPASRMAGSAGSATPAPRSRSTGSARRRLGTKCCATSASPPRTWRRVPRRCSSEWHEFAHAPRRPLTPRWPVEQYGRTGRRLERRERRQPLAEPGSAGREREAARGVRVAVAFDHRGVKLRERLLEELDALGHEAIDLGTDSDAQRVDYPDKARDVGAAIAGGGAERAILVCGSGVGASVAACKLAGIRAAICHDVYSAHQGVEHDDMNVLCLGSEVVGAELAADLVRAFLRATFDGGERYVERLRKVEAMEKEMKDGHVTPA